MSSAPTLECAQGCRYRIAWVCLAFANRPVLHLGTRKPSPSNGDHGAAPSISALPSRAAVSGSYVSVSFLADIWEPHVSVWHG